VAWSATATTGVAPRCRARSVSGGVVGDGNNRSGSAVPGTVRISRAAKVVLAHNASGTGHGLVGATPATVERDNLVDVGSVEGVPAVAVGRPRFSLKGQFLAPVVGPAVADPNSMASSKQALSMATHAQQMQAPGAGEQTGTPHAGTIDAILNWSFPPPPGISHWMGTGEQRFQRGAQWSHYVARYLKAEVNGTKLPDPPAWAKGVDVGGWPGPGVLKRIKNLLNNQNVSKQDLLKQLHDRAEQQGFNPDGIYTDPDGKQHQPDQDGQRSSSDSQITVVGADDKKDPDLAAKQAGDKRDGFYQRMRRLDQVSPPSVKDDKDLTFTTDAQDRYRALAEYQTRLARWMDRDGSPKRGSKPKPPAFMNEKRGVTDADVRNANVIANYLQDNPGAKLGDVVEAVAQNMYEEVQRQREAHQRGSGNTPDKPLGGWKPKPADQDAPKPPDQDSGGDDDDSSPTQDFDTADQDGSTGTSGTGTNGGTDPGTTEPAAPAKVTNGRSQHAAPGRGRAPRVFVPAYHPAAPGRSGGGHGGGDRD
jgi:hypothetical protein